MCLGTTHHHQTQISLGPRPSRRRKNLDPRMHAIFTASISVSDPPPHPQLLKYIMLKLQVHGCIIILVYSIRFGCLWITCIYICQGFFILIEKSFGQSHDVFCFGSPRNYQQIAFMVLWQKNKEFSLAYLKIPFSHENKEQICFICIEKNNEISNFWV